MSARPEWLVVVRLRQLGDVLAALAVLQAIKAYRPERRIAYVVDAGYVELLRGLDFIDALPSPPRGRAGAWRSYLSSVRALRATAAIDLHGNARSALITVSSRAPTRIGFDVCGRRHAYTTVEPRGEFRDGMRVPHTPIEWGMRLARHVGAVDAESQPPQLPVSAADHERARAALLGVGISGRDVDAGAVIGLNPGRFAPVKSWAKTRFAELARRIGADGRRAVVFWGPGEEDVARAIVQESGSAAVLAPATPLRGMPALVATCAALVTIDSGLKHLAVCTRVPTVTVFGATDPREWHMGGARDAVLWRRLSCSPCRRLACPFGAPCMDVSVDDVWDATRAVLSLERSRA